MSEGTPKKKSRTVTLKRSVAIKAEVTDKFKQFLAFEMDTNIQGYQMRLSYLESELKLFQERGESSVLVGQYEAEIAQIQKMIQDSELRKQEVNALANGEMYMQGMIDGFVTVSEGDNLYEKLGGMEITVKDGIVQSIAAVPSSST